MRALHYAIGAQRALVVRHILALHRILAILALHLDLWTLPHVLVGRASRKQARTPGAPHQSTLAITL